MRKVSFLNLIAITLLSCSCQNKKQESVLSTSSTSNSDQIIDVTRETYCNPCNIIDEDGYSYFVTTADPDVILAEDGYFYMYPTNCTVKMGGNSYNFDRGPIFRSRNMHDWKWVGSVFQGHSGIEAGNWGTQGAGVWAPSILKIGKYYNYYYSLSTWGDKNAGVGVARSLTPYGPWEHYGKVIDSNDTGVYNSIDPYAIEDNGNIYLIWGSFYGIAMIQLTDDGLETYVPRELFKEYEAVKYIIYDGEIHRDGFYRCDYEGSYIIKKDGKYFYMGSSGSCCSGIESTYHVRCGVADKLEGPYIDDKGNNLNTPGSGSVVISYNEDTMGVGHNAIVQDFAGDYWIVYHGFDVDYLEHNDERILYIDKILWDEDTGFPYVENKVASVSEKVGPLVMKEGETL